MGSVVTVATNLGALQTIDVFPRSRPGIKTPRSRLDRAGEGYAPERGRRVRVGRYLGREVFEDVRITEAALEPSLALGVDLGIKDKDRR